VFDSKHPLKFVNPLGIMMPNGLCFADATFFHLSLFPFNDHWKPILLSENVLHRSSLSFQKGYIYMGGRVGINNLTFFPIAQGMLLW